jgi:prepilin-type N-terminal cleavage/methylation domain-containing protein
LGVTLIELLTVLVIMSVLAAVASVSLTRFPSARPDANSSAAIIIEARRTAITQGRPVTISLPRSLDAGESTAVDTLRYLTVFPDGSVIADPGLRVGRLSGTIAPARGSHAPR